MPPTSMILVDPVERDAGLYALRFKASEDHVWLPRIATTEGRFGPDDFIDRFIPFDYHVWGSTAENILVSTAQLMEFDLRINYKHGMFLFKNPKMKSLNNIFGYIYEGEKIWTGKV